jgi:uncharacterized damage-inducible protein DinB
MKEIIGKYVDYNLWANQRLLEFLLAFPTELLDKEVPNSFRSLKKTLLHIWDAELLWLSRIKGHSMSFWPSEQFDDKKSLKEMLDVSLEWKQFVQKQESSFLNQNCFYKSIAGQEFSQKVHEITLHCMNHSTFHRGQIVTALRILDVKEGIPQTDLIAFLREKQ